MLLAMTTWDKVRWRFSEEEKADLNAAICGESICPRGAVLDEAKLAPELLAKVNAELAAAAKGMR